MCLSIDCTVYSAQKRENSFSRDPSVSYTHSSGNHPPHHNPPRHTVKFYGNRDENTPEITPLNSVKKVQPQPTAHRPDAVLALNDLQHPPPHDETAVLRGGTQSNYGSIGTIMSTMSSMTVTVVMLCGLNSTVSNQYDSDHSTGGAMRELLATTVPDADTTANTLMMVGMVLGWISSVIYISSRIPQMRLMVRTKV